MVAPNMLTPKQAAARQSVSVGLVYRWCATRRLVHYRVGATGRGKILIAETDLDALMGTMLVTPRVPAPVAAPPSTPLPPKFRHIKLR